MSPFFVYFGLCTRDGRSNFTGSIPAQCPVSLTADDKRSNCDRCEAIWGIVRSAGIRLNEEMLAGLGFGEPAHDRDELLVFLIIGCRIHAV